MNKWILVPNEQVGKIKFGMTRTEVRTLLGDSFSEFKKNRFSINTTDNYDEFHVFYNSKNMCEALEFYEGELYFENIDLMKCSLETLKEIFSDLQEDGDNSYVSKDASVAIAIDGTKVESVLVGEKDYYNF